MYIKVHVYAGMKKEQAKKLGDNYFELVLKAPAERNLANARVKEIMADLYMVPLSSIKMVPGHHSPRKILEIIHEV